MGDVDRIDSDAQFRGFIRELDALATLRPRRKQLPVVIFDGSGSELIIQAYQQRLCPPPNHRIVPHAHIADKELARIGNDDIELFDLIGERLRGTMPDGMHMPSLDNLQLVIDVLKTQVSGQSARDKIDILGDQLYERHRKHRRDQEEARHLAKDGAKALINTSPVSHFSPMVDAADKAFRARFLSSYYFGLKHTSRYQWFIDEIGKPNNSFLGAALDLVQGGAKRDDKKLISRLLMLALLKDLANATRLRPFMPYRYRHTSSFTVLLEKVGVNDEAAQRFIEAFIYASPKVAKNSLCLIVAADKLLPLSGMNSKMVANIPEATGLLKSIRGTKDHVAQLVAISLAKSAQALADAMQACRPVRPIRRRVGGCGPLIMLVIVVAASIFGVGSWLKASSPCKTVGQEKVGLNVQGECTLLGRKNISEDDRKVEKDIVAQNIQAERDVRDDNNKKIVSMVAFLPLTTSDGSVIEGNLNQLRAIAQAQEETNETAKDRRVRIIIANAGHELSQAAWVGGLICKQVSDACDDNELTRGIRVGKDPTIAGVIGIAESRSPGTFDALQAFTDARLPVIGSSITASTILDDTYKGDGKEDNYTYATTYHITPSNPRQTLIAGRFAQQRLAARNAVVIAPEGDEYGLDVAQSFEEIFTSSTQDGVPHKIIARHGIKKDKPSQPSLSLQQYAANFSMDKKEDIFSMICRNKNFDASQDIVYYAGRSEDFADMTRDLAACGAEKLSVMAGSDLTRFDEPRDTIDLYYASFSALADKEIEASGIIQPLDAIVTSSQLSRFQQAYQARYREPKDFSNPARAYDAYGSLWRLIAQVNPAELPLHESVLRKLKSSNHAVQFPGATGYIDMGKGTHISPFRPIFIIKKPASGSGAPQREVELVCGRFNNKGREGHVEVVGWKWESTAFSCP